MIAVLGFNAMLLCGGCGDSASLTKTQFVRRGNAICRRAEARRSQAMAKALESVPQAQAEHISTQEKAQVAGLPAYEKATEALRDLGAPKGEEEEVDRLLRARGVAAARVREAPATAYFSTYPFRQANDLLEAYGLDRCLV